MGLKEGMGKNLTLVVVLPPSISKLCSKRSGCDPNMPVCTHSSLTLFCFLQELDKTDPSHRLVAHNKRSHSPSTKFTTKLSESAHLQASYCPGTSETDMIVPCPSEYNENVLDSDEQDAGANFNDLYPSMASSVIPKDSTTETVDTTTDEDTIGSDDGHPSRLKKANHMNGGRQAPGSAMLASAHSSPLASSFKRQMISAEGVKLPFVNDKTWKEVQQLCNIESGPNLVQRIENGARGIGELSIHGMIEGSAPVLIHCPIKITQHLSSLEKSKDLVKKQLSISNLHLR